jgi:hypothetical protein
LITVRDNTMDHKKLESKYFSTDFKKDFDKEGFSIYKSVYKFNDDFKGRPSFVNRNAVNGFIQTLDDARKYSFGSLMLVNEKDVTIMIGYWIIRGQEPLKEVFGDFLADNDWSKLSIDDSEELNQAFYGDSVMHRSIFL